jgi:RimJ/RimL family protein N-acetyltransferase
MEAFVVPAAAAKSSHAAGAVVIETERLLLRCWQPGDAELFNRHCNTKAVMHWLGGVQSKRELRDDVQYFADYHEENGYTFWVMERRSDGEFLGFCGFLHDIDEDSTVEGELEIGWRLRADEWRNGYAEEAAKACLDWAFAVLKPRRVVSRTAETNMASRRLMEKLGMRRRPELDYDPDDGSERLVVYTISKRQRQAAPIRQ